MGAPLPPTPNMLRTRIDWFCGGDQKAISNVHWAYSGGPPAAIDAVAIGNHLMGLLTAQVAPLQDVDTGANTVITTDMASLAGAAGTSTAAPYGGSRAGGILPASTCVLINKKIARRYRGGKPRTYLPAGTSTDLVFSKLWNSALTDAVLAAWEEIVAGMLGFTSGTCVVGSEVSISYFDGFTNVPYGIPTKYRRTPIVRGSIGAQPIIPPDPIVSYSVREVVASQRRRNKDA